MRELTFFEEAGIGPWKSPRRGSLADLVLALPYVVTYEIPPRRVLNDVLVRGRLDAGMSGGCIWKPLELDDAEFGELVEELQRRGTRPVAYSDYAGGEPFGLPDAPESVRTFSDWVGYRSGRLSATGQELQPAAGRLTDEGYDRWLDELPVGELYIGYLDAINSAWQELDDDAFELPAELVAELRRLDRYYHDWAYNRVGMSEEALRGLYAEGDRARHNIRACVDSLELPRWPFDRFKLSRAERHAAS